METTTFTMTTRVTGTDTNTYEIQRAWDENGKRALILELYPTITKDTPSVMDLSSLHLHNHASELELGSVSICNLYSTVFTHKPLSGQLSLDEENISYIEGLLEQDFDEIIIAWGSSLQTNKSTNEAKLRILRMLMEKNLKDKVKHIVGEYMDAKSQVGTHVLYLGLHNSKEVWTCEDYPIESVIMDLEVSLKEKQEKVALEDVKNVNATGRKGRKKKDVLQDQKQA